MSFKLEHLTKANGLAHEAAHDALSDVRATIALARLIRQKQPRLWDFCLKLRKKDAVWAEIGLAEPRPFLCTCPACTASSAAASRWCGRSARTRSTRTS